MNIDGYDLTYGNDCVEVPEEDDGSNYNMDYLLDPEYTDDEED